MFNVGGPEVLVILLVALIALGPGQLPQAARKVGQVMSEIRRVSTSFQRELKTAFDVEEDKAKEKPTSSGGPTDRTKNRTEASNGTEPSDEPDEADEVVVEPDEAPVDTPTDEGGDTPTEATSGETARSDT